MIVIKSGEKNQNMSPPPLTTVIRPELESERIGLLVS